MSKKPQGQMVILLTGPDSHCSGCGKNETVAFPTAWCRECWEAQSASDKQAVLDAGLRKCDVCKESKSWWRRKFPRTARYYKNGLHLCKVHRIVEELKDSGEQKEEGLCLQKK